MITTMEPGHLVRLKGRPSYVLVLNASAILFPDGIVRIDPIWLEVLVLEVRRGTGEFV